MKRFIGDLYRESRYPKYGLESKSVKVDFWCGLGRFSQDAFVKVRKIWRSTCKNRSSIHITRLFKLWKSGKKIPIDSDTYLYKVWNDIRPGSQCESKHFAKRIRTITCENDGRLKLKGKVVSKQYKRRLWRICKTAWETPSSNPLWSRKPLLQTTHKSVKKESFTSQLLSSF